MNLNVYVEIIFNNAIISSGAFSQVIAFSITEKADDKTAIGRINIITDPFDCS